MTKRTGRYAMRHYPWSLPTRLAARIEDGQAQAARDDLSRVLARFDREHAPALTPRKLRCAALMSFCLRGAHRGGAGSEAILEHFMTGLEQLARKRTWSGVCSFMRQFVDTMLAEVRPQRASDVERLVRSIRAQMHRSPDRAWSLKQYAYNAGLNPDYLSRKFTELTGESFRAERKQVQIDRAMELLTTTSLKVSVIARQVGMRDCSRFIRHFKDWTGMTPAAYRKARRRGQAIC